MCSSDVSLVHFVFAGCFFGSTCLWRDVCLGHCVFDFVWLNYLHLLIGLDWFSASRSIIRIIEYLLCLRFSYITLKELISLSFVSFRRLSESFVF